MAAFWCTVTSAVSAADPDEATTGAVPSATAMTMPLASTATEGSSDRQEIVAWRRAPPEASRATTARVVAAPTEKRVSGAEVISSDATAGVGGGSMSPGPELLSQPARATPPPGRSSVTRAAPPDAVREALTG